MDLSEEKQCWEVLLDLCELYTKHLEDFSETQKFQFLKRMFWIVIIDWELNGVKLSGLSVNTVQQFTNKLHFLKTVILELPQNKQEVMEALRRSNLPTDI